MPDPVSIRFDLDQGTLDQQPDQALDTYRSGTIHFDPVTLSETDDVLRIRVDFVEQENGTGQEIELRTLGVGAAVNSPSTFATRIGTGHEFGPGFVLGGPDLSGSEHLALRVVTADAGGPLFTGPLRPEFAAAAFAIASDGDPDLFEFPAISGVQFLPDLLDDPVLPLRFGGITLEVTYVGFEPSLTLDSLAFNIISAEVDIERSPPPPPETPRPKHRHHDEVGGGKDDFAGEDGPALAHGGHGDDIWAPC
jgi:hypothetical protein